MKTILVIADPHDPFSHPNYLKFCQDTAKGWGTNETVCIGDLVDNHAISRHQTESVAMGALQEREAVLKSIEKWTKAFPKVKLCLGNHDTIPTRQLATLGIPEDYLKSFKNTWGLPKGWEIAEEFIIDNILFKHTPTVGGKSGCFKSCLIEGMNVVAGHLHSVAGVQFFANKRRLLWTAMVGSGIHEGSYAFNYGKNIGDRPILSCLIIKNGVPHIIPMGEKYFRN
jgi:hypothetical protein